MDLFQSITTYSPAITLKDGTEYVPQPADIDRWQMAYPQADVLGELRKMSAWCDANPSRRKTPRGVKRFVVNWLSGARPERATSTRHTSLADDLSDTSWA